MTLVSRPFISGLAASHSDILVLSSAKHIKVSYLKTSEDPHSHSDFLIVSPLQQVVSGLTGFWQLPCLSENGFVLVTCSRSLSEPSPFQRLSQFNLLAFPVLDLIALVPHSECMHKPFLWLISVLPRVCQWVCLTGNLLIFCYLLYVFI